MCLPNLSPEPGLVGAVVGAIGKGYASRQKLRDLEFEYEKRLQDRYLENARVYLASVYVPLSISLTKLNTAYQGFRSNVTIKAAEDRSVPASALGG